MSFDPRLALSCAHLGKACLTPMPTWLGGRRQDPIFRKAAKDAAGRSIRPDLSENRTNRAGHITRTQKLLAEFFHISPLFVWPNGLGPKCKQGLSKPDLEQI